MLEASEKQLLKVLNLFNTTTKLLNVFDLLYINNKDTGVESSL